VNERVEPEWAMATIAFVDLRGFTTFADQATAREAAAFLTGFFAVAIPVIEKHGGHVNKLLGDGLLAVFGAPDALPDHADRALAAAAALVDAVAASLDERYRVGIGVNSGLVLVGTIGVGRVQGLEIVGDPVNVAARVQEATKDLDEPVLVTAATAMLLDDGSRGLAERGELTLRGKTKPIRVYGLDRSAVTIPGRSSPTNQST
jgi:adenylate cyclase